MTYRIRNIAVAVALALLAAMLSPSTCRITNGTSKATRRPSAIFVAKSDIPVGTPGADIIKHHLLVIRPRVIQRTVVPGAISNADQVQNLVTAAPIFASEQVTLRRFAGPHRAGPRAQLHGTLRAIDVRG